MTSLMTSPFRQKLLIVYLFAGLLGFIIIIFENVYIIGLSWVEKLHDVVLFVFTQAVLTALVYYWITIRGIGKWIESDHNQGFDSMQERAGPWFCKCGGRIPS